MISILYMLGLHSDIQTQQPQLVGLNVNANTKSGAQNFKLEGSMLVLQLLDVMIGLVHGWSLVMLIRDRRNQPRNQVSWSCCCLRRFKVEPISMESNETISLGKFPSAGLVTANG